MRIDNRLPALSRLGIGYEGDRFRVAADAQLSWSQSQYAAVRGQGGVETIQPRDASGNPTGTPLPIGQDLARDPILNASVGVQIIASPTTSFQLGLFTDRSGLPMKFSDELHPHLDRYGVTIGVGKKTARSATYFGLLGTVASGQSLDLGGSPTPASGQLVLLTLGGSANFGGDEPDQPQSPASPAPLYTRWWFWTVLGAVVGAGTVATIVGLRRSSIGNPESLGSQGAF